MRVGERLLRVLTAETGDLAAADAALHALRRAAFALPPQSELLLFCDLPPSPLPGELADADVCRRLRSGVSALGARIGGRAHLLVRRRAWDDAARAYLGADRAETPEQAVASLLTAGEACDAFVAATVRPGALKGRFDCALFAEAGLLCAPDTPARMLARMRACGAQCAGARVLPPLRAHESPLDRLTRAGFSLSCAAQARRARLAARGLLPPDSPALLCAREALEALARGDDLPPAADARGCLFVRRDPPSVSALLAAERRRAARAFAAFRRGRPRTFPAAWDALLPAVRLAALMAAALAGYAPLAAAAVALPEYPALLDARLLPGALARLMLLPPQAMGALHALACRLFARARLIRPRLPDGSRGPAVAQTAGAALLLLALRGVDALAPLLLLALLWLAAPLLYPALELPQRAPSREALDGA